MTQEQTTAPAVALAALKKNLEKVIYGKTECIDVLIIAMLSNGAVLLEDIPGVGKTTLAKALARSINLDFSRIQFTPDLLPADILGSSIYNPLEGTFDFRRGPIFCHVLLADEINRASPRTQSALLEAMNESQSTIEGVSYKLPEPFLVLATQNPVDFHGTYPLPEAQLDRFLVRMDMGYPAFSVEVDLIQSHIHNHPLDSIETVMSAEQVRHMQHAVREIHIDRSVSEYIISITRATRQDERLKLGVSPRGSIMLSHAAQASAYEQGRDYVLPDDVQRLALYVLPHRLIMTSKARFDGTTKTQIIKQIVETVKVPT